MARRPSPEEQKYAEAIAFDRQQYQTAPDREVLTHHGVARLQIALKDALLVTNPDGHGVLLFPTEQQRNLAEKTIKEVGSPWKKAHHIVTPLEAPVQRAFSALHGITVQVPMVDELKLLLESKQLEISIAEAHTDEAFIRELSKVNRQLAGAHQRTP